MTQNKTTHPTELKFAINFRDKEHFNTIVKWLNTNVGHGKDNWTMDGRILRHLKQGKPIVRNVIIRNPDVAEECSLYLTLL